MKPCLICGRDAEVVATRAAASFELCTSCLEARRDELTRQGWNIPRPHDTQPIPVNAAPTFRVISLDTPIGVIEEILDADSRLHDVDGVAAYRRFWPGREVLAEFRHHRHGVCHDPSPDQPAWCIYGLADGYEQFLATAMRYTNGVLTDTITSTGARAYAVVNMDRYGNATRIESWIDGVFNCLVDPATLPSY